jgi:hypothetical protein
MNSDNNLWNLKKPGNDDWRGTLRYDHRGHAVFDTLLMGCRAAIKQLYTYQITLKLQSLNEIFNRWAPAYDTLGSLPGRPNNDPNEYAKFVGRLIGIAPDSQFLIFKDNGQILDHQMLMSLLRAMAQYEGNDMNLVTDDLLEKGICLYYGK